MLRRYGARPDADDVDVFLAACPQADRRAAEDQLDRGLVHLDQLTDADRATIHHAAETGNTAALRLMLDLGFPVEARGAEGGTPLHTAAYAGSAETVRLLLDRGADLEARDSTWESTPLVWATMGSGERPENNPHAEWVATVNALLEAGALTEGLALSADDLKPPSREVADILRTHGVHDQHSEGTG